MMFFESSRLLFQPMQIAHNIYPMVRCIISVSDLNNTVDKTA